MTPHMRHYVFASRPQRETRPGCNDIGQPQQGVRRLSLELLRGVSEYVSQQPLTL